MGITGYAGFFMPVLFLAYPRLRILLNFILYSRSNCPLCEAMEDELRPYIEKYNLTVNRQYIDNEPELVHSYGNKIPVLTLNNETLCEYFLDPEILLNAIRENKR